MTASRGAADVCAVAALALATLLLYHGVLSLFWTYDSPFHLRLLAEHSAAEFLFARPPWRVEKNVFTPLLFLSLDLDRGLGGLSPAVYYAHQLAAVGGCAAALYATLRLWLAPRFALAGAALFLAGPSVAASAPILMVRHYFEALAWASLAVLAFALALRRRSAGWAGAAALFYLAALLSKEIAAPAIVAMLLLPDAPWREKRRHLTAPVAALLAYAGWRMALLEQPLAGHGWIAERGFAGALDSWPGRAFSALFGNDAPAPLAWLMLLVLAASIAALPKRAALAVVVLAVAAFLPAVPVAVELQPRMMLAPWLVLAGGAAAGWAALAARPRRLAAAALAAAALVPVTVAGRTAWAGELALARRMSVENRAFLALGGDAALRHPASATSTLLELRGLLARSEAAGWFQDDVFLCAPHPELRAIWTYDETSLAMREATAETLAAAREWCGGLRHDAPLEARFWWRSDGLHWQLGPHSDPGYSFVMDDGRTRIAVARQGGYAWQADSIALRVRYQSADGWVTYSPPLESSRARGELRWQR